MKFFGFGRNGDAADLAERREENEIENKKQGFGSSISAEERRKKFIQRIKDISAKLEEISIQLYHLTQRVEILEKRTRVQSFD